MFDILRERMSEYLSGQRICIITAAGAARAGAIPVWYRVAPAAQENRGLTVDCLLPRWSQVAYDLEHDSHVQLLILDSCAEGLRWLECQGSAQTVSAPEWAGLLPEAATQGRPWELYLVIRVTPSRLDLLDESRGWSARETLDL